MNKKTLKIVSIGITVLGFGISLLSDTLEDKLLDTRITEEVSKKLSELSKKES